MRETGANFEGNPLPFIDKWGAIRMVAAFSTRLGLARAARRMKER
jgi:hypothetical protein